MKIKTIILTSLLLSTNPLKAENFMLIMGGGGEPNGNTTIFDSTMKTLGNNLKSVDWKYQASFNGGHSTTEQIMSSEYPTPTTPRTDFTPENYAKLIEEYKAKILLGEIGQGDQLMIIMNTHGAAKYDQKNKTHKVSASGGEAQDLNNLSGSKLVDMDALEELVKLTNEKGIKLGLVDLSCHSGNTMALKKDAPNTCIITATGPNHYGFAGDAAFSGQFMKNLKKGTTLEKAFLEARSDSVDASFPMISTDESEEIVAEVYASITPYLYYYDAKADKLSAYLLKNSKDCVVCDRDQQFQTLMNQIDRLQEASGSRSKRGFKAEELKKLLTEYKKEQDEILAATKATGYPMFSKKEEFVNPVIVKGKKVREWKLSFTWGEMMNLNPDSTIAYLEKSRLQSKTELEKAQDAAVLKTWQELRNKRNEIIAQYPELKNAQENSKKIIQKIGTNRKTAEKIAQQEKKFYDELYRDKQSLNVDDPCRKIVF